MNKLTEEEIARTKAENLAKAAKVYEANKQQWKETARQNEEIAKKIREAEAAAYKARLEEKKRERGETIASVVNGIDPALHHNVVSDLRSEIASLREQLKNQGSSNLAGTLGGGAEDEPIYSEPWQDHDALIDEALENEFGTSNTRKPIEPSAPPLSACSSLGDLNTSKAGSLGEEEEKALETIVELDNLTEPAELSTHLKVSNLDEAEATNTAIDLDDTDLGIDLDRESDDADITAQHVNTTQTASLDEETLLKKAEALRYISHDELRVVRKVASNHIKQRIFERNMLVAVAAGDESESDQSQILGYSVWSNGAFGTAKQKTSNNSNGYSYNGLKKLDKKSVVISW